MTIVGPIKPTSPAITEIERLGFTWREDQAFDLERLSKERRVQCRETDHYAPPERVEEYANQMSQTVFPPIVVTEDNWLIDGATRQGAYEIRKVRFTPVIIVETPFDAPTTTAKQKNQLYVLGVTLNQQNGERLTLKEKLARLPMFFALGWKLDQIVRATALGENHVRKVKKELEIRTRMERVGLPHDAMTAARVQIFTHKSVDGLNHEPFKQLVQLADDAGLKSKEVDTIAKDAAATGSDDGALRVMAEQRAELRDRIQALTLTGTPAHQESKMFRNLHLGYINKFIGREQELIETDPNVAPLHIDALGKAIAVLNKVMEMQK